MVGGAIRDRLLGLPVKDIDYVVVGASPEELIEKGFKPVGQDFPVFLHPSTNQEYALARTERKVAPGYKGFVFHANREVTLEEDLARRDLTVNAIAQEVSEAGQPIGELIDPFGGIGDIQKKVLRHIGPAFTEDPVRLLRVARFAARFSEFSVAPETIQLLNQIGQSGELKALVKERVWQEFSKGLMADKPSRLLETLKACQVFESFFPCELLNDEKLSERLDAAAVQGFNLSQRIACLWALQNSETILAWSSQWGIPTECKDYSLLTSLLAQTLSKSNLKSEDYLDLLDRVDVWRKPERFCELMKVIALLAYSTDELNKAYSAAQKVDVAQIAADVSGAGNQAGSMIKEKIRAARLGAIKAL